MPSLNSRRKQQSVASHSTMGLKSLPRSMHQRWDAMHFTTTPVAQPRKSTKKSMMCGATPRTALPALKTNDLQRWEPFLKPEIRLVAKGDFRVGNLTRIVRVQYVCVSDQCVISRGWERLQLGKLVVTVKYLSRPWSSLWRDLINVVPPSMSSNNCCTTTFSSPKHSDEAEQFPVTHSRSPLMQLSAPLGIADNSQSNSCIASCENWSCWCL